MDQARARALLAGELLQAAAGEQPATALGDEVDDAEWSASWRS
jgi:hypothetical protein